MLKFEISPLLHKQSLCDSMNSGFFPTQVANISVHFEHKPACINQLLSVANAKDIWEGDPQQKKRVRTWAGSDALNEIFLIGVKIRPLFKLRHVSC